MNYKHFDQLFGLIGSVFDVYSALLFLPLEPSKYRIYAYFTLSENLKKDCIIEAGQGIVGWILKKNKWILIDNLDQQGPSYYLGYYNKRNEEQIKSFMGCPLNLYHGHGAVCLDSKQNYSFTRKDQQLLQQFVFHLEKLLNEDYEQIVSYQKDYYYSCLKILFNLRWEYPRWQSFLDNFLKKLAEFSGFQYSFFTASDQFGQNYYLEGWNKAIFPTKELHNNHFVIDKGLIGWVFRNNLPITKIDKEDETSGLLVFDNIYNKTPIFRSLICCPIIIHYRTRSVLVIADEKQKEPTKEFHNFITLITDHLAVFLENLYLKNKLKKYDLSRISYEPDL